MNFRFTASLNLAVVSASVLSSVAPAALAAEEPAAPVIVTASRYSELVDETLASTTVLSRDDIEASNASTLEELLQDIEGFDLRSDSVFGKNTSIFMRGTGSSHLVTFIDGVKFYAASAGSTAFQHIPLSQIDRIEIVRGPRSGLYGSEAIGGVIQIFTRNGTQSAEHEVDLSAGSFNTTELSAGTRGTKEKLEYSLFVSQLETDGIDAREHTTANDDDGYLNRSLNTRLGYEITPYVNVEFSYLNTQGDVNYDNCYNASYATSDDCLAEFEKEVMGLTFKIASQGIWDASYSIGQSKDLSDNFWEGVANNTYETVHTSQTLQNNFQISDDLLVIAGIDLDSDTVEATPYTVYDDTRDNSAVFASVKQSLNAFSYDISLRSDDNEQFGTHSTGSVSLGYKFSDSSNMFVSYGTGFKAPTFNELYFPFYGNTALEPEESVSTEIGFRQTQSWGQWNASVYETTIDNLIGYDSGLGYANNIGQAEITGLELSASAKLAGWDTKLAGSFLEPLNQDAGYVDNVLPARSKQNVSVTASRQFGKANFSLQVKSQGKRYGDASNTIIMDGYTLVNTKLRYQLKKDMTLDAKINNLLDEEYQVNAGYNTPGINGMVSLKMLFK